MISVQPQSASRFPLSNVVPFVFRTFVSVLYQLRKVYRHRVCEERLLIQTMSYALLDLMCSFPIFFPYFFRATETSTESFLCAFFSFLP